MIIKIYRDSAYGNSKVIRADDSSSAVLFSADENAFSVERTSFALEEINHEEGDISESIQIDNLEGLKNIFSYYLVATLALPEGKNLREEISQVTGVREEDLFRFASKFYNLETATETFTHSSQTKTDKIFAKEGREAIEELISHARTRAIVKSSASVNMAEMATNWGEWT